jgi:hypothetical protein
MIVIVGNCTQVSVNLHLKFFPNSASDDDIRWVDSAPAANAESG